MKLISENVGFGTLAPCWPGTDKLYGALATPIYQTSTLFDTVEEGTGEICREIPGFYSRGGNPDNRSIAAAALLCWKVEKHVIVQRQEWEPSQLCLAF